MHNSAQYIYFPSLHVSVIHVPIIVLRNININIHFSVNDNINLTMPHVSV